MNSRAPYIAWSVIVPALNTEATSSVGLLASCSNPKEIPAPRGYVSNNKQEMIVVDEEGKKYKITVQDIE